MKIIEFANSVEPDKAVHNKIIILALALNAPLLPSGVSALKISQIAVDDKIFICMHCVI